MSTTLKAKVLARFSMNELTYGGSGIYRTGM